MWDKMETPAIVYDLDTSGGLMQQIQALLAPPKSEDGEKRSRKPDKNARRAGRATNHDTCDSCREGGDLLCCDHCPAAFHLQCCNPPLSKEMLPPGDWMCHRCMVRRKKRELKKEQINGLLERQLSKQSSSPAAELELAPGTLRLDPTAAVGGTTGLRATAVAQVRLLERRPSSRPNTPTSTASTDTPTPSEQNYMDDDMLDVEDDAQGSEPESSTPHLKRPFDLLIAAAMERNPTQFQLPNELTCTTALPGTSKKRRRDEMTGKNVKRPQHELDHNGLVPLPVKVCYPCGRSCRLAPLIQCDYCPLLFHMDCLDPPLTAMPVGKWMCPNHIEHMVLKQRSLTLSGRCQLFDQFQDRMSQHAVKVDFLQRVHRLNPPVRRGAHTHLKKTLKVPDAIKSQYKCPPAMMAPAGIRNGELICNISPESSHQHRTPSQHLTSEDEQQEWLRDVITLQCSIVRHLSAKQKEKPSSEWDSEQMNKADIKPCGTAEGGAVCTFNRIESPASKPKADSAAFCPQGVPALEEGKCSMCTEKPCHYCVPSNVNSPLEQLARTNGSSEACRQDDLYKLREPSGPDRPVPQTPAAPGPELPNHTGRAVVKTEKTLLKPCAVTSSPCTSPFKPEPRGPSPPHRPSQGTEGPARTTSSSTAVTRALTPPGTPYQIKGTTKLGSTAPPAGGKISLDAVTPRSGSLLPSSFSMGDLSSCLKAVADCHGEIQMSSLDEKFIELLAWQRIQQLFGPKAPSPPQSSCISLPPVPQPQPTEAQNKDIQARAVFYPLTGKGGACSMCYRSLYIGTGADMDVCLTNYGHCNYVSGKHACIFYDENTKQYELLNYSEHGTMVDNVLYSCDFSEKTGPSPSSSLVSKVQNIIKRCKRRKQEVEGAGEPMVLEEGVMSQCQGTLSRSCCDCKASSSSLIGGSGAGWEGTALLHHGSFVKLGCMQFVFSITEFACKQPKEETLTTPNTTSTATSQSQEGTEPSDKHTSQLHQVPVIQPNPVP
ncbi:PHD finger protein 12-like [Oncorhynchus keta]|uniref:PHD finger protein 12-like n=1 Tax=Oncorhynchus keta TaxID=8018 RepID=UPI0015FDF92C|nr:PHD finger protein 12-like [Oncorhynchus keta]XP_035638581.1 PHD finger protein 12-like [Oncorhynchus keta]XP_035638582.1 PHD finger protein 12-like [Oncorhynchus keta]